MVKIVKYVLLNCNFRFANFRILFIFKSFRSTIQIYIYIFYFLLLLILQYHTENKRNLKNLNELQNPLKYSIRNQNSQSVFVSDRPKNLLY